MALLRYTLRDTDRKIELQASWVEELYYGPVLVKNGYARVPDNDDVAILVLCNRGFELVKEGDEAPKKEAKPVENKEPEVVEQVEDDFEDDLAEMRKELQEMSRADLNKNARSFGLTEDAKSFNTKPELIDAILAAYRVEED